MCCVHPGSREPVCVAVALDGSEPGALDCTSEHPAADVPVIVRRAVTCREHEGVIARVSGRELRGSQLRRQQPGEHLIARVGQANSMP